MILAKHINKIGVRLCLPFGKCLGTKSRVTDDVRRILSVRSEDFIPLCNQRVQPVKNFLLQIHRC